MATGKQLAWDDLRLVRAIAEARGMAGAGASLGIDQSTVFRRLGNLEAAVGSPLFDRHRTGYVPTPAGEEIVAAALRIDEEVSRLERRIRGREIQPAGEIRVTTADSLLTYLLTPLFARFRERYPDIRLDVVIGNPSLNLSKRDADVAIRATDRPPETLVGRRIGAISWALYGRIEEFPDPTVRHEPADLAGRCWVLLGDEMAGLKVVRTTRAAIAERQIGFRANSVLAVAEAIEAGIGIGHIPCFIGDVRPGLRRLSDIVAEFSADLWLLTHQDLRHSPRIRAFLDFMAAAIQPLKPLIEGELSSPPVVGEPPERFLST